MYTLDRLEIVKDNKGIDELFFSILISDEVGVYNFAKWLTKEEFEVYKKDNSMLDKIILTYLPIAKQNRLNDIECEKTNSNNLELV